MNSAKVIKLPSHNVMLICRFKRKWRRTHLISRKTEDDDNSSLAFFFIILDFLSEFLPLLLFLLFYSLASGSEGQGVQQRWRLVAVRFFLLLFVCTWFFFFFVFSPSFLHSASPFFFPPLCFSSLSSSPLCLVFLPVFPPLLLSVRLSSGFYSQRMHPLLQEHSSDQHALAVKRSP